MIEYDSDKQGHPYHRKIGRSCNLPNTGKSFSTKRKKMIIFRWEKPSVFDSTGSKRFLINSLSGTFEINILMYAGKRKSEADLRKMIKIVEELLKSYKNKKVPFSHAQPSEKRNKKQQRYLMNSDRFYFCVPT